MTDERKGDTVKQRSAVEDRPAVPVEDAGTLRAKVIAARNEVARAVVGQEMAVSQALMGLMCGGHVLIEGAPGLGKTLLVRTLGTVCGLRTSRIQFTPDLMPADITGTIGLVYDAAGRSHTRFQPGPVFAELVLADEVNRATPKTQSALLEAMQERTVTVAGEEHVLPEPFFVFATQNPVEMDGTYRLPEAQLDRFLIKIQVPYPTAAVLDGVLDLTTGAAAPLPQSVLTPEDLVAVQQLVREVAVASHVRQAVVRVVLGTQPGHEEATADVRRLVEYGVSPRGAQAWLLTAKAAALLKGRFNVSFEDLRSTAYPVFRHRFRLNFEGQAEGADPQAMLGDVLNRHLA